VEKQQHAGLITLGIDPAAGGDNSAMVLKSANHQEVVFNQKLNDVMDLVGVAADKFRAYGCEMMVIDRGGLGEGVYRRLQEMGFPSEESTSRRLPTRSFTKTKRQNFIGSRETGFSVEDVS